MCATKIRTLMLRSLGFILWYTNAQTTAEYHLYQTDREVWESSLALHCLHYYVKNDILDYKYSNHPIVEIIPYCVRPEESYSLVLAPHTNASTLWTFEQLRDWNVTAQQLYAWSAPIDLVEQYQLYLENNSSLLPDVSQIVYYNCSFPAFGQFCPFTFDPPFAFSDIVSYSYKLKSDEALIGLRLTNGTCYTHLKCVRGPNPVCLDWREICDGKIDCMNEDDFGIDERNCIEVDLDVCDNSNDEFQCHNGQCIPHQLYNDDVLNPDCTDGTDEPNKIENYPENCQQDPGTRCEDRSSYSGRKFRFECGDGSSTDYPPQRSGFCKNWRVELFTAAIFSHTENPLLSYNCSWTMMVFLNIFILDVSYVEDSWPCRESKNDHCFKFIEQQCEQPLFFFPYSPVMFGHIRLLYTSNQTYNRQHKGLPLYVCYNDSECSRIISTSSSIQVNGSVCHLYTELTKVPRLTRVLQEVSSVFQSCSSSYKNCKDDNTNLMFRCDGTNPSGKCVSTRRLSDGTKDCHDGTDEDTNFTCSLNDNKWRFRCSSENKCISHLAVLDTSNDCRSGEDEIPHSLSNDAPAALSFATMCDGFIEVNLDDFVYERVNETDETNCEHWPCDNVYTRCNGFWNCKDGMDELNCSISNTCTPDKFECVSPETFAITCLPVTAAGNEHQDCLGGMDERFHCRTMDPYVKNSRYRCWNSTKCIRLDSMCNGGVANCDCEDDKKFCEVRYSSDICSNPEHKLKPAHVLLCKLNEQLKPAKVYFRLDSELSIENNTQQGDTKTFALPPELSGNFVRNVWLCNRGVIVWRWTGMNYSSLCMCPPSYYGHRCQFQNQRVSLSFRVHTFEWETVFNFVIMLIDSNTSEIHSYDQQIFLSSRDCHTRFDIKLLYAIRPKNESKTYSIRIDVFEKGQQRDTIKYRMSWLFPIKFSHLPVHRISTILSIPSEMFHQENCSLACSQSRSECVKYVNKQQHFCRCLPGWYGVSCQTKVECSCAFDSLCVGFHRSGSICVCSLGKYGPRCFLTRSSCHNPNPCMNGAQCLPVDQRISEKNFTCICKQGYVGRQCEDQKTTAEISFADDVIVPQSVFAHFITVVKNESPVRTTTFKKIAFDQQSVVVPTPSKYHVIFVQFDSSYYLSHLEVIHRPSTKVFPLVRSSYRCFSTAKLFNLTILSFTPLRRLKYYHIPCRENQDLQCFYDKEYMCLCSEKEHHANCFEFNHNMTYNCAGSTYCQNGAHCFQDSPTCPSSMMCVCDECYYGSRCQFSSKGFGISLDTILGYQIRPHTIFTRQTLAVKVSVTISTLICILGLVSSTLSIITFSEKRLQEVGCGVYLLVSSITSVFTMLMLTIKVWFLILAQTKAINNRVLLNFDCRCTDFLLKLLLSMGDWYNASVAVERAATVTKGVHFDKTKSKRFAKWVILVLLLLNILTSIQDPLRRNLIDDVEEQRTWCIVSYSHGEELFNSVINVFHSLAPFVINLVSAFVIIISVTRQRSTAIKQQAYKQHLNEQLRQHKHLLISPTLLVLLALPRLIIVFMSGCMKSARDPWIFLVGYFVSLIPPILTFAVFVLPSEIYRKEFVTSLERKQIAVRRGLGLKR